MMIRSMTASFGKLKNETLTLHEGLNIVSLPNESGKSTWSEFLLAMLYGVDTSERQRSGGPIPVKERFRPWDGSAMQGSMELEHNGKHITIERTSSARAPMSQFSAYLTDSGLPLHTLDGKNCGAVLIGAERSVYERSGFVRQRGTGLSKDASLEQRLAGLVSTADEDYSYISIDKALNAVKNRCKHNQTGLLPATERELTAVETQLASIDGLQKTLCALQQRECDLLAQRDTLQAQLKACEAAQARQQWEKLQAQQTVAAEATARRETLEAQCRTLPQRAALAELSEAITRLQERNQAAVMEAVLSRPELPQAPDYPMFAGLSAQAAAKKAEDDRQTAQMLLSPTKKPRQSPILCIPAALLAAVCAVLAFAVPLLPLLIPAALLALFVPVWLLLCSQKKKEAATRAAERAAKAALLAPYHAETPEQLPQLAAQYANDLSAYEARCALVRQELQAAEEALAALNRDKALLLTKLQAVFPDCDSLSTGSLLLRQALSARDALDEARRLELSAHSTLELLRSLADKEESPAAEALPVSTPIDPTLTRDRLSRTNDALVALRSELHRTQGLLDGMGDRVALEAKKEQLSSRREELSMKYAGLTLAQETLAAANNEMQSRFAPLLCGRAGELFRALTGGKYDKLLLDQELTALCREAGSSVTHTANALSCGTVDQAYLAVRLAICEMLLSGAPLVLDDALVCFDDERCRLAMDVLRQEAQHRQIILFTCQQRELMI